MESSTAAVWSLWKQSVAATSLHTTPTSSKLAANLDLPLLHSAGSTTAAVKARARNFLTNMRLPCSCKDRKHHRWSPLKGLEFLNVLAGLELVNFEP